MWDARRTGAAVDDACDPPPPKCTGRGVLRDVGLQLLLLAGQLLMLLSPHLELRGDLVGLGWKARAWRVAQRSARQGAHSSVNRKKSWASCYFEQTLCIQPVHGPNKLGNTHIFERQDLAGGWARVPPHRPSIAQPHVTVGQLWTRQHDRQLASNNQEAHEPALGQ